MTIIQRTLLGAGALLLIVPLVSCVAQGGLGKVSTIDEVVDAFTAAGGVCNWKQDDVVDEAVASGNCSDAAVISIYANSDDRDQSIENNRAIFELLGAEVELNLLVGENWIINSPEAESMQSALGGEWVAE